MADGFSADDLNRLLVDSQDQIIASVKAKLIERLSTNYEWQLSELINAQVKEFFAAEVAPVIAQNLRDAKGEIVAASTQAASKIAVVLGEAMVAKAVKTMASDWDANAVFKALFKN